MVKSTHVLLALCIFGACGSTYSSCGINADCGSAYAQGNSPITISMDSYPEVNIVIYAPDFNSSPYAIDTIGDDGSNIVISTGGASIPYRLVETGPDTGYFAGYVTLSSSTSVCSPVCGPTDGFITSEGNSGITVSFTYKNGQTISASSHNSIPIQVHHGAIPEFPSAMPELLVGLLLLICLFKVRLYSKSRM